MNWGLELRKFRVATGMKQAVLAAHLDVSQAYISRLESGSARPSVELIGRIRKLIETPQHRPHFEHWLATVKHSPHLIILCSLQTADIRVEAVSAAMREAGPPWSVYRPGSLVAEEIGEAAHQELDRFIRLGAFSGDVSAIDGMWYSKTGDTLRYWRTINVPVRDQIGNWYLHSTNLEVAERDYRRRLESAADSLLVSRFQRAGPVPARALLADSPPRPPGQ